MKETNILDDFMALRDEEQRAIDELLNILPRRVDEDKINDPFYIKSPWPKETSGNTFPSIDDFYF